VELAYDFVSGAPGEALDRFPLPALAVFVSADVRG